MVRLMEKIILYYKFVPVTDPVSVMFWQRNLCEKLKLKGRVIVAEHGINGTLGGRIGDLKQYIRDMNKHPAFKGIHYKWSDGSGDDFPRLSVKVRKELVTLAPDEQFDVFNSTKGLKPKEWHEYLQNNPDVIVLDARNDYESAIGAFRAKRLIKPKIKAFRDIKSQLNKLPKDKPILTYCTGDIRCEYLSAYMKHKGFSEVYHLDGGIMSYGRQYGDDGFWEGKCFVFDRRLNIGFSNNSKDVGLCLHCSQNTSNHTNCANKSCNRFVLICQKCVTVHDRQFCSGRCKYEASTTQSSVSTRG